jgi:hypothetical protein
MERHVWPLMALLAALLAITGIADPASASAAEPTILFLSPETFPVELDSFSDSVGTELKGVAGFLVGLGYVYNLTETSASAKTYSVDFHVVSKGGELCNSPGDPSGTILISANPYKLVFDSLSPLGVAALFTVNEFTIECHFNKLKVKGDVLGLLTPINTEGTAFKGNLHCSATGTKPAETKFWNSAGAEETAKLEANFGTGFKEVCLEIEGEQDITASKMIEIMG